MPYARFIVVCLVWGASFILMKKAGQAFGPVTIAALRVSAGALVLGTLLRWGRGEAVQWRHLLPLTGVALVGFAIPYAVQPSLVRLHGSGFIGMTIALVPLLTLAVSPLMIGVYPSRRQMVGVLGGLVCMLGIMGDGLNRQVPLSHLLLASSVPLSYALTNTYIRQRFAGVNTLALSAVILVLSAAMLWPVALVGEQIPRAAGSAELAAQPPDDGIIVRGLLAVLFLGVLGTGLATYLFNKMIQEQGPLFAGMTTYLVPIGAMLWGWLDNEQVTPLQIASLAGILLMVALVQYGAARPKENDQPMANAEQPTDGKPHPPP